MADTFIAGGREFVEGESLPWLSVDGSQMWGTLEVIGPDPQRKDYVRTRVTQSKFLSQVGLIEAMHFTRIGRRMCADQRYGSPCLLRSGHTSWHKSWDGEARFFMTWGTKEALA